MTDLPPPAAPIRRRDRALGLAFVVAWLIPLSWTSLTGSPPESLSVPHRDLCAVTCLFPDRPVEHVDQYVQIQRTGTPGWIDLDEPEFFRLQPFGHRTRLDRYLARWAWQRPVARRALADWIAQADARHDPGRAPVIAIRLGVHRVPLGTTLPEGRFRKPERRSVANRVSWGDAIWIGGANE